MKVKRIKRGKIIGVSCESETFEAGVIVKRGGRKRTVKLAERHFFKGRAPRELELYPLRDPIKQFEIMTELRHLNNEKNLSLHILPTIRLRKRFGRKPTILLTHYKKISLNDLPREQKTMVLAQQGREQKILKKQGYVTQVDAWKLIKDPLTGEPTYYLTAFGGVKKISPFEQE